MAYLLLALDFCVTIPCFLVGLVTTASVAQIIRVMVDVTHAVVACWGSLNMNVFCYFFY